MGGRLYGFMRSSSSVSTADVLVEDFDNSWGLETRSVPVAYQKRWGKEHLVICGENRNIGTTVGDLSDLNTDNNYMVGTAVSSTKISSSNKGDTYRSGGVQIVCLDYIDINWDKQTVNIPMSGNKSMGVARIFRPLTMNAHRVGRSGTACGNITLTDGLRPLLKIVAGKNFSRAGYSYIPRNKNYLITDTYCSNIMGNVLPMDFFFTREEPHVYSGSTNYVEVTRPLGNSIATYGMNSRLNTLNMPMFVDEKCRIRLRSQVTGVTAGGSGQAVLRGFLVDKKA
jgi:hypothetical protein